MHDLIELINSALPQYQCGRCDTPGCRPYAKEIAEGSPYNRCVPGGKETLDKLQAITKRPPLTLDDEYNRHTNWKTDRYRRCLQGRHSILLFLFS